VVYPHTQDGFIWRFHSNTFDDMNFLQKIIKQSLFCRLDRKTKPLWVTGFTMLELLVTLSIFIIITTVIMSNYPKYGSQVALGRITREMALLIRQAQVFGIAVQEVSIGSTRKTPPFGVSFSTDNSEQFIFFSDKGLVNGQNTPNVYDEGDGCNQAGNSECESSFELQQQVYIASITVGTPGSDGAVVYSTDQNAPPHHIVILFVRPDPDALFFVDGTPQPLAASVTIELRSARYPDKAKRVRIWTTGQIAVVD